jgi:hypothetical protein
MCFTNRRNAEIRSIQENAEMAKIKHLMEKRNKAKRVLAMEKNRCEKMQSENQELHNEIRKLNVRELA